MVSAQGHSSIEASRLVGQHSWLTNTLRVGWGEIWKDSCLGSSMMNGT